MATYIVKSGDSLSKIALKFYGDATRYREIAEANGIANPDLIHVGDLIDVPDDQNASAPADSYSSSTLPATIPQVQSDVIDAAKPDPNKQFLMLAGLTIAAVGGYWAWNNKDWLFGKSAVKAATNPVDDEEEIEDEDDEEEDEE